jgi:orotidine-5'-phosphate decarboxylase
MTQGAPKNRHTPASGAPDAPKNRHTPAYAASGTPETRHTPAYGDSGAGFGARLAAAVGVQGALCVGIDPHPQLLRAWGLPLDATGLERFALSTVDALAGVVAVLKPQSAFFEAHGARGVAVLERTIAAARDAGVLVIVDAKRGDIGSTMAAYAAAYLGEGSPLAADAVTLSPYLGFESLRPALDVAAESGRGVFVLTRTSNRGGADVQTAVHCGRTVAQSIVDAVVAENHAMAGRQVGPAVTPVVSNVGIVVGATGRHGLDLSALDGAVLAPGLGAQGATAAGLRAVFDPPPRLLLPSTSRDVLRHGPDPAALRRAACAVLTELRPDRAD